MANKKDEQDVKPEETKVNEPKETKVNEPEETKQAEPTKQDIPKELEAKIRAEERDKYIKELNKLKEELKNKEMTTKEFEQKVIELEQTYQKQIEELKQKTLQLSLEKAIADKQVETGIVIPTELVKIPEDGDIQKAVEEAYKKTLEILEKNSKKARVPKPSVDQGKGSEVPDLDSYTSAEELKKDLYKFFKK